jgi:peptidoglycan/xylan/chitin deacetylase (PgdA/CDA1 family)/GT2 family glycosyltransferase
VIPTFQRRDLVAAGVAALARQDYAGRFEVIVVVDGSTDGTAETLRQLDLPLALVVLEQPNRGAAAARNHGAARASEEILLFLDDDMEADPRLLSEHARSHRDGADVVLGHMPLHPASPSNFLSAGVGRWAEERCQRLSGSGVGLSLDDLLTGQMSLRRSTFERVAGFDRRFTGGGSFGNEDLDLGWRLRQQGLRIVFNPRAISWQRYVVSPRQQLRQWYDAGRADVALARKHPEVATQLFSERGMHSITHRWIWRPLAAWPRASGFLYAGLRRAALLLVEQGVQNRLAVRLFSEVRAAGYWRGVSEAGGIPDGKILRVLAYHAIAEPVRGPLSEVYCVPASTLRRQLTSLRRAGFQFIDGDELVAFLDGRSGLPRKSILLTFDDGYADLLENALPVLRELGVPAMVFAVSGRLGATNEWDRHLAAPQRRLLDAPGLRELARRGIEIGAHSRTHPILTNLPEPELTAEVRGSVEDLEREGLPRPRFFSYPYGEADDRVQRIIAASGLAAAFTVEPGVVDAASDRLRLPRIEIAKRDVGWRIRLKLALAGAPRLDVRSRLSRARRRWPRQSRKLPDAMAPGGTQLPVGANSGDDAAWFNGR